MLAYVHEPSNLVVPATHDDDRLFGDVVAKPVSLVRDTALVADTEPMTEMDPIDVALEDLGICVEFLGEGNSLELTFDERGDSVHRAEYTS